MLFDKKDIESGFYPEKLSLQPFQFSIVIKKRFSTFSYFSKRFKNSNRNALCKKKGKKRKGISSEELLPLPCYFYADISKFI